MANDYISTNDIANITLQNAEDIIALHSSTGKYLYVSPSCERLLGYQQDELIGQSLFDFVEVSNITTTPFETEKVLVKEYLFTKKNGEKIWLECICKEVELRDFEPLIISYSRDISKRKSFENRLMMTQNHYKTAFNNIAIGIAIATKDGHFSECNEKFKTLFGYTKDDLCNMSISDLIHPQDLNNEMQLYQQLIKKEKKSYQSEVRIITKNKQMKWVKIKATSVIGEHGNLDYVMGLFQDITDQREMKSQLIEEQRKYQILVEQAMVGVFVIQHNKFVYANPALEKLIGYKLDELRKIDVYHLVVNEDRTKLKKNLMKRIQGKLLGEVSTYRAITKKNKIITIEVSVSLTSYQGEPAFTGTLLDITEKEEAAKQINHLAFYDSLTDLPNRNHLTKTLNQYVNHKKAFALFFIDLDRFKLINDSLGHSYGDELLKQAAKRIQSCLKENGSVFRYGGDEFIIIVTNSSYPKLTKISEKLLSAFKEPFTVFGESLYTTPSIGISQFPQDADDVETLIKFADTAMYVAKDRGRNNYYFYRTSYNKIISRKMKIDVAIRDALQHNDFILYYQPQVNLQTKEIIGFEALIRWRHKDLGIITPNEFIPVAEETGLIVPIGIQVIELASQQFKNWLHEYENLKLMINVSPRQLQHTNFANFIKLALEANKIRPSQVTIEITESIMQKNKETLKVLNDIRDIGCRIALDDFGTGYSSLNKLSELPINTIKIDRSFVKDLYKNQKRTALIRSIIHLSHELNFEVIAEGIEHDEQIGFLINEKCHCGQGFLFSKPIPIDQVEQLLKNQKL